MEGTNYREVSYAEAAAKDNSIFTAYTKQWGMHIRPWYSMDKLKFSFVEVGKAGKGNSFDICMDIIKFGFPCFKKWANDILSPTGRFERIMSQEAKADEQYPKHYKFVTGEKGSKSIGIANSRNGGYIINASTFKNGNKVYANIPLDFGDLQIIAENFIRSYAAREQELANIRVAAEKEIASHYTDPDAQTEKAVIKENVSNVTENKPGQEVLGSQSKVDTNVAAEHQPQSQPATVKKEKTKTQDTSLPAEMDIPEVNPIPIKITLAALPVKVNGELCFKGINGTGKEVELYATKSVLAGEQKEQWTKLADVLKERKVSVIFLVHEVNGKIEIDKIA